MKRLRYATHWLLAVTTAAFLAVPGSLSAQATGQITGIVSDASGSPLPGVAVTAGAGGQVSGLTSPLRMA